MHTYVLTNRFYFDVACSVADVQMTAGGEGLGVGVKEKNKRGFDVNCASVV